ncbi:hypothetical protein ASG52_25115 [Methylobacterium sp. Leaf456]|uniref:hypothetical protein n=1 Tax=Methylobacterium sp. Leaf456 TaxID=1736382 RepID=UPI0006F63B92|nr:hypothetical protein [Methylobacterium sp. Leaf456]KQT55048.1 hypothetical protein ASG52_25115 [Methylobacterium sp. Leaf456]
MRLARRESASHPQRPFAAQRQQIADGTLAVETAFPACTAEEEADLRRRPLAPAYERRGRIWLRTTLKNELLGLR